MPSAEQVAQPADRQMLATTRDAFLGGSVYAEQPRQAYRAGLDAVLLAAAVAPLPGNRPLHLLDVGAGVGVVGLCVAARLSAADVTMVEQSPDLCALAQRNIADNGFSGRARVIQQDITARGQADHHRLDDNSFDVTVSNPPFYGAANHRQSPHPLKAASHAMPAAGLEGWLRYMARKTKSGGTAIVVHRADQLAPLLAAFSQRFGGVVLQPLHPRDAEPASRIILRGIKGSRAPLLIRPGIALHEAGNGFTPAIDKILKSPTPLALVD